ncbi:MAG: anhydro-N-acetylmuramic acid kinase, partial [Actinobacteria bacterium]|nr:anhydro-N-acetylmuramic acid kinase [Actinomycetota bacterium]
MRVIGCLSGTSLDGIEIAAADLTLEDGKLLTRPLGSRSEPYPGGLRGDLEAALPPARTSAAALCRLDALVGQAFADAADRANEALCEGAAELVVSHGQTVFHWVEDGHARGTLQVGQPAWIAERLGVPVVSDLRSRDIAAGGHGAPLVALFDVLLLGSAPDTRGALNLGGIANVTIIPGAGDPIAFDVGPGNALIDAAVTHLSGGAERLDEGGRRAARGSIDEPLLNRLLSDPYYALQAPKSTGKEHFHLHYLLEALSERPAIGGDDVLATVTELTGRTVGDVCRRHDVAELVVSGGGSRNATLLASIARAAPGTVLRRSDDYGIPSHAKEAYAFAVLGFLTVHGLTGSLPSCTGARA